MKRHGMQVLDFHAPALIGGELTYFRGSQYVDRVVALCFLTDVSFVSAETIDRQTQRFQELDIAFVIVDSDARPLHRLWIGEQEKLRAPILTDLCGRLHRLFGVAVAEPSLRCHTFIIDRAGVLRLRVSHDFVDHDMTVLRGLILSSQSHVTDGPARNTDSTDRRVAGLSV